VKGKEPGFLSH